MTHVVFAWRYGNEYCSCIHHIIYQHHHNILIKAWHNKTSWRTLFILPAEKLRNIPKHYLQSILFYLQNGNHSGPSKSAVIRTRVIKLIETIKCHTLTGINNILIVHYHLKSRWSLSLHSALILVCQVSLPRTVTSSLPQ